MEVKIKSFTDLYAWQSSHKLVIKIYEITKDFPDNEKFGLISQMRRAAISVTSNIAEGFGRQGCKEKINFYYISQGSLIELKSQLLSVKDIGYIDINKFNELALIANEAHRLLQGLITKTKTFITTPKS